MHAPGAQALRGYVEGNGPAGRLRAVAPRSAPEGDLPESYVTKEALGLAVLCTATAPGHSARQGGFGASRTRRRDASLLVVVRVHIYENCPGPCESTVAQDSVRFAVGGRESPIE